MDILDRFSSNGNKEIPKSQLSELRDCFDAAESSSKSYLTSKILVLFLISLFETSYTRYSTWLKYFSK